VQELAPVIESVVEFVRGELEADAVELQCSVDPLPPVSFDENQIRQALLNLLRNAREAMQKQGGALTLEAAVAGEQVEIRVADRGPGMDPEALKQVFDPFFTTKEKGTGLGLAITSQIVEEHGGSIRAEPRTGGGLRMVMALPLHNTGDPHPSRPTASA
jgi:signal transduction histidine kinase